MARLLSFLMLIALPALSWAQAAPPMTWGSAVNVSNTPGRPSYWPRVAATGNTVHVTWYDDDSETRPGSAYYKRSLDGGVTWQDQHIFSDVNYSDVKVLTSSNNVVVCWEDQVSGQYIVRCARSTDAGATWSATQDISPALSSHPQCVDGAVGGGRMVIHWGEIFGSTVSLKMRISTDDGQTWGSTLNVTSFNYDPNQGAFAQMAIAGSAIMVGYLGESPFAVRTVRSTDWGQTWSSPVVVYSDPPRMLHQLRIATSGSSVVMRWERFFGAYNDEAMAAASADGGLTWSTPASLSAGLGGSNGYGDVCIWGNRAVAVWTNNPAPGLTDFPLYYRCSLDGGQTWEPATVILTGLYRFAVPKCTATPNSVYIAGYADPGSREIYPVRGDDPNRPPVANAGSDQTVECTGAQTGVVLVAGV